MLNLNGYEVKCDLGDDVFAIVLEGFGNTIKSGSGKCSYCVRYPTIYPEFNFMSCISFFKQQATTVLLLSLAEKDLIP